MNRKNYYDKLRKWEAEGYDVSELREKWFPARKGKGQSHLGIWLSVIVAVFIVVAGIVVWQATQPAPSPAVVPTPAPTPTPAPSPSPAPIPAPVAVARYTLAISSSPAGAGSISPNSGTYDVGASVSVVATPTPGYRFDRWSGDASSTSPSITITMNSNKSVTAYFKLVKIYYNLTTSVSPPGSGSVSPSSGTYESGTAVTLTATPSSGYQFNSWSGDASGTSPTISITMNSNKNVIANFSITRYTLSTSVSPSGGGSISPGSGAYDPGTSVTLTATPATGYKFDSWSGDASGTNPTITITMNSNMNMIANFSLSTNAEAVSITQQMTATPAGKGILSVGLRYADGKPIVNRAVYVYTQKKDVAGNWVQDSNVAGQGTDNGGRVSFDLTSGQYALRIDGLAGYKWGNMINEIGQADVPVKIGYQTEVVVTLGRLTAELVYADGKPIVNRVVYVYTQKKDVAGNWVQDSDVAGQGTDNGGRVSFDLTPGQYALRIDGLAGYNWGNMIGGVGEVDVAVRSGQTTVKRVDMGRLTVGITSPQGGAAQGVSVYVYTQKKDVTGNWVQDSNVASGQTDNSGMVSFDLTPGQYAIRFRRPGDKEYQYLYNVAVEGGKIANVVK